jgi:GntR family transcriptional regulator
VPLALCLFAVDLAQLLSQSCRYRCLTNGPVAYGSFELSPVVAQLPGRELADRVWWLRSVRPVVMSGSLNRPDVPKHVQLAQVLRRRIDDETYQPGNPIPSEPRLVQEFGIARDTVRKGVDLLINERRLYRVRGLGTFVGTPPYEPATPWPPPPPGR